MKTIEQFKGEYAFLSNFHPAVIRHSGLDFPTVEHAYVAAKTKDLATREYIQQIKTPGIAKKYGQKINVRPDWNEVRVPIMRKLITRKFEIPELRQLLIGTYPDNIIEGNYWGDSFWGIDLRSGKGLNWLGILLMEERLTIMGRDPMFIY